MNIRNVSFKMDLKQLVRSYKIHTFGETNSSNPRRTVTVNPNTVIGLAGRVCNTQIKTKMAVNKCSLECRLHHPF